MQYLLNAFMVFCSHFALCKAHHKATKESKQNKHICQVAEIFRGYYYFTNKHLISLVYGEWQLAAIFNKRFDHLRFFKCNLRRKKHLGF